MVESVFVLPLLLLLLVISFDLLRLSYTSLSIRFVTSRAIREASLGNMTALEIKDYVLNSSAGFGVPVSASDISMCRLRNFPCPPGEIDTGSGHDLVVLDVRAPLRGLVLSSSEGTLISNRVFDLRSTVLGRIEPG